MNSQVEKKIEDTSRMERRPKVSVCVVTYNQEKYIGQCLQSLVDQKTNFDFEIIVGDDCSTDGTREIVRQFQEKYPNIVKPIFHEKNLGPCRNVIAVYTAASADYICHMDGDDYALPGKLQAQVDVLDNNSDCVVVWHRMKILDEKSSIFYDDLIDLEKIGKHVFTQRDLMMLGSIACHSSKCFRKNTLPKYYPSQDFMDFFLNVVNLSHGTGVYLNDVLGVYRSGVGLTQSPKIKETFLRNLRMLLKEYPENSSDLGVLFLKTALINIKNNQDVALGLKLLLEFFRPSVVMNFLRTYRYIKFFRSPI
ncbi:glycosyltransferase family 2 protein [Tepidiphilus margaritifer]|uniref:glycosyltransferase family 2 protein n=1 Tax=Tepidiphilus margaritifer TaxID=203471 RepID=UPI000A045A39|nr:glycosyltransferase [Tepidiphilus margaritifer]